MAEPVIPVGADGSVDEWWRQVVEVAGVEGLVDVDVGGDLAGRVSGSFGLPVTALADIDRSGVTRFTVHPSALAISEGPARQAPVLSCVGGPLWQAVLAGDFTAEHERAHREFVSFRRPRTGDEVGRAAWGNATFLDRTVDSFYENYTVDCWPTPALVWATGDDDFIDCLWFWNMRVLRSPRVAPCPIVLLPVEHWVGFARLLAAQFARLDEFAPDVSMNSFSVPEDRLRDLAEQVLGLHHTDLGLRSGHRTGAETRVPPFTYQVNMDLRAL